MSTWNDLAADSAFPVLVISLGEENLIHIGNNSYAIDGGRIIDDLEAYSESS